MEWHTTGAQTHMLEAAAGLLATKQVGLGVSLNDYTRANARKFGLCYQTCSAALAIMINRKPANNSCQAMVSMALHNIPL
jgi:hypothetical protein